RPAQVARALARLDLEQPRGEEDELAARRVVQVLDVALRRLAEEQRAALEGGRGRARAGAHRHLAQLDRRLPGLLAVDPDEAHASAGCYRIGVRQLMRASRAFTQRADRRRAPQA